MGNPWCEGSCTGHDAGNLQAMSSLVPKIQSSCHVVSHAQVCARHVILRLGHFLYHQVLDIPLVHMRRLMARLPRRFAVLQESMALPITFGMMHAVCFLIEANVTSVQVFQQTPVQHRGPT